MEEKTHYIEPLVQRVEAFGKTTVELLKLQAVDKTALVVSNIVSNGLVVLMLSMFIVIVNIGVALWLGDLLHKTYYGFFCVAGFYGIVGGILYFFMRKRINQKVSNSIVLQLLNQEAN